MSDLAQFRASITAPTPFTAVADIIPDGGDKPAIYGDALVEIPRKPLTFANLQAFCKSFDLSQFGISLISFGDFL